MKKYLDTLKKAVAAGWLIGIAGTVFLSVPDRIAGAFLFSGGLLAVVLLQLKLYTGKIGYAFTDPELNFRELALIWLGNLLGTGVQALLVNLSAIGARIAPRLETAAAAALTSSAGSLLAAGLLCGVFMFIAVEGWRRQPATTAGTLMVVLGVMGFILSGSMHSVANMFYLLAAGEVSLPALAAVLVMTAGNTLGSWLAAYFAVSGVGK